VRGGARLEDTMARGKQRLWWWALPAGALVAGLVTVTWGATLSADFGDGAASGIDDGVHLLVGRRLFENETFGGNGRTCLTCHSRDTGTVSPEDAQRRFARSPNDPLFQGDGSDDGNGNGALRMLTHATVLVNVPLAGNVTLAADAKARTALVRRGIPSTLNNPALDPVLMYDGRQHTLDAQAQSAILDHAAATRRPSAKDLERIAEFERTRQFFSSKELWNLAVTGKPPALPTGRSASEKRGREFFEDAPLGTGNFKRGICAICHSGPMLNETNEFIPVPPLRRGGRFQSVLVSELNEIGNPVQSFVFANPDGTTTTVASPDPGRALVTGKATRDDLNAFKIPTLWGVSKTAPYFHDNSAQTIEDAMLHYKKFFAIVTDPAVDGDAAIDLTDQDQKDIIAFMRLLR
jgi:cytochrome c peroxidase